jgi:hypothetical protein
VENIVGGINKLREEGYITVGETAKLKAEYDRQVDFPQAERDFIDDEPLDILEDNEDEVIIADSESRHDTSDVTRGRCRQPCPELSWAQSCQNHPVYLRGWAPTALAPFQSPPPTGTTGSVVSDRPD